MNTKIEKLKQIQLEIDQTDLVIETINNYIYRNADTMTDKQYYEYINSEYIKNLINCKFELFDKIVELHDQYVATAIKLLNKNELQEFFMSLENVGMFHYIKDYIITKSIL